MVDVRAEFRPFRVESKARPYRLAFLVNPDACPPELLDSLFDFNYGVWGGRFNPIIPVRDGQIDEAFWFLLKYVDPDLLYTYTPLAQGTNRPEVYVGWGAFATTYQQATSRESLLSPPRSQVPIDQGTWVMDLRVEYLPQFAFYANEVLFWKLPRRLGVAEAFFPHASCRIDIDYSISVEMRVSSSFMLRIPDEGELLHRVAGVMQTRTYDTNLNFRQVEQKFRRMSAWDKGLYLNGILNLLKGSNRRVVFLSIATGVESSRECHMAPLKRMSAFLNWSETNWTKREP